MVVVSGCIMFVIVLYYFDCEVRKLRKLVKQKEAEVKRYKMERDAALAAYSRRL